MSFRDFCADNLIFGTTLVSQSFHLRTKKNLSADSHWSFVGSLILIALYYEGPRKGLRISELTKIIGLGKRANVEASVLIKHGYIQKDSDVQTGKAVLFLTALGEQKALELIGAFKKLQGLINFSVGKERALELNKNLCSLHEVINKTDPQSKHTSSENMLAMND